MQKIIRAFIAADLPRQVKAYLGDLSAELARQVPPRSVRWVNPQRMHLTLRFLGDTEKNLLPDIGRSLDDIAAQHQSFTLRLAGFGCFPNCRRPRVLWAGVGGEVAAAEQLKGAIDEALFPLGWEKDEKPYRPHLTVGRIKDSRALSSQRWPDEVQPLAIPVQALYLIESQLTPDGPVYTVHHSSSLLPSD